ncbi:MAG: hypothetical protein ACYCY7_02335 [Gallionella sp.]
MLDIAESEAKVLLSGKLRCINCEPWIPHKVSKFLSTASAGTVDSQGINPGIIVTLDYFLHPLTQIKHYKFSVFKQRPYGLERVYQLDVRQSKKPLRDVHSKPHEHFGDKRTDGDDGWSLWSYYEALEYFCTRTNISFEPPVKTPDEAFKLT